MRHEPTVVRRPSDLPLAAVAGDRGLSIVWGVPLIAAIIGGVLAYQTWVNAGARITIRFQDGAGVTSGQTPIRYHGIECGIVDAVSLSKDLQHVIVRASLKKEASQLARQGAKFWIVRPQVSLLGVRGLETLVSGPYIQAAPGDGPAADAFIGLTDAPPPETLEPGLDIILESDHRGALRIGSPVYYREVEVGQVKGYRLGKSAQSVEITAYIDAAHAGLVRTTSRFWSVSGLQMSVGFGGLNLDLESIESLLTGGVAFDTPPGTGAAAKDGAVFRLQEQPSEEAAKPNKPGLRLTLIAKRLAGVGVGSPVSFRELRVGEVEKIGLAPDSRFLHLRVRIDNPYRPLVHNNSKFWNVSGVRMDIGLTGAKMDVESLQSAISGGIQFATPDEGGAAAADGSIFALYEKAESSWTEWTPSIAVNDASAVNPEGGPHPNRPGKARKPAQ